MEIRQLRYFVAVAESEHVTRAAEALRVAQPAISRQIRLLEQELRVELFVRRNKRLSLSPAGRELMRDARRILAEVGALRARAHHLSLGTGGTLRICYSEASAWIGQVPDAIRIYRTARPGIDVALTPLEYPAQLDALESDSTDLAFLYGPPPNPHDFEVLAVRHETLVLAMTATHRLANAPRIRLRDLTDEPFVWIARKKNNVYHAALLDACRAGGLTPYIVQETTSRATLLSLIASGLGVGFMLSSIVDHNPPGLRFRKVADLNLCVTLSLCWRRDHPAPAVRAFVDTVRGMPAAAAPPTD